METLKKKKNSHRLTQNLDHFTFAGKSGCHIVVKNASVISRVALGDIL